MSEKLVVVDVFPGFGVLGTHDLCVQPLPESVLDLLQGEVFPYAFSSGTHRGYREFMEEFPTPCMAPTRSPRRVISDVEWAGKQLPKPHQVKNLGGHMKGGRGR